MTLSQTENFQHLVSVPGAGHALSPLTPVSCELFCLKAASAASSACGAVPFELCKASHLSRQR